MIFGTLSSLTRQIQIQAVLGYLRSQNFVAHQHALKIHCLVLVTVSLVSPLIYTWGPATLCVCLSSIIVTLPSRLHFHRITDYLASVHEL